MSETLISLTSLFNDVLGEIPPEFEGLVYIFSLLVLLFVIKQFFGFFGSIFGISHFDK